MGIFNFGNGAVNFCEAIPRFQLDPVRLTMESPTLGSFSTQQYLTFLYMVITTGCILIL